MATIKAVTDVIINSRGLSLTPWDLTSLRLIGKSFSCCVGKSMSFILKSLSSLLCIFVLVLYFGICPRMDC